MSFVEFLRATVLLTAGAASALAAVTVVFLSSGSQPSWVATFTLTWWAIAIVAGVYLGRRRETTAAIATLLAEARAVTQIPEYRPGRVLLNRLWPLLISTLAAMGAGILYPQVPAVGTGFAIIWALAWRHQHRAVEAIERRDGVNFHVDRTRMWSSITLTRTPGFKAYLPERRAA